MGLLTGEYHFTLDEKGRIILPAPIRKSTAEESDGNYVIYYDEDDGCLQLYTAKAFDEKYLTKLTKLSITNKTHRAYFSRIGENSIESKIDNQGRVKIPQILLDKANIKKDVVINGAVFYIEIWDPQIKEEAKARRGTKGEIEAKVNKDLRE